MTARASLGNVPSSSISCIMLKLILLYIPVFLLSTCPSTQVSSSCEEEHHLFLKEQNELFANEDESPLPDTERMEFEYVNYFQYDSKYCIEARWLRTPDEDPFEMITSTDRLPIYVKFGELHFEIDGRALKLAVYQNESLIEEEGYEDYLFVPFNDLTNGVTSYGGGRYMDMRIPASKSVRIDLNNTYHPYCAYNPRYSCPLPPEENMLDIAIEAGVKTGLNGELGEKH